jgi:hypothetical protein
MSKENMYNRKYILGYICLILIIAILPIISAFGIDNLGTFKQNDCVNLIQTCSNCSFSNITAVIYPNSTIALAETTMSQSRTYFYTSFCNTSLNGIYIVTGFGDPDGSIQIWDYSFSITPNGEEASVGKAVFYIGLLIVLLVFLIGTVVLFMENGNLLAKVGMFGLGYLLLIAITFIGWNMASDFLTSSPFLIEMLRILFIVLVVGAFPLLIGAFAWYVLMMFKIKEIEDLMKHGMSMDEAEHRQGRKFRR